MPLEREGKEKNCYLTSCTLHIVFIPKMCQNTAGCAEPFTSSSITRAGFGTFLIYTEFLHCLSFQDVIATLQLL